MSMRGHAFQAEICAQDLRIDFQFSDAAFDFKALPFKIPYPVPFKLLGDETKVCDSVAEAACAAHVLDGFW